MSFQIVTDLQAMDEYALAGLLYVNTGRTGDAAEWVPDTDDDAPSEFLASHTLREDGCWVKEHTLNGLPTFYTYHWFGISLED